MSQFHLPMMTPKRFNTVTNTECCGILFQEYMDLGDVEYYNIPTIPTPNVMDYNRNVKNSVELHDEPTPTKTVDEKDPYEKSVSFTPSMFFSAPSEAANQQTASTPQMLFPQTPHYVGYDSCIPQSPFPAISNDDINNNNNNNAIPETGAVQLEKEKEAQEQQCVIANKNIEELERIKAIDIAINKEHKEFISRAFPQKNTVDNDDTTSGIDAIKGKVMDREIELKKQRLLMESLLYKGDELFDEYQRKIKKLQQRNEMLEKEIKSIPDVPESMAICTETSNSTTSSSSFSLGSVVDRAMNMTNSNDQLGILYDALKEIKSMISNIASQRHEARIVNNNNITCNETSSTCNTVSGFSAATDKNSLCGSSSPSTNSLRTMMDNFRITGAQNADCSSCSGVTTHKSETCSTSKSYVIDLTNIEDSDCNIKVEEEEDEGNKREHELEPKNNNDDEEAEPEEEEGGYLRYYYKKFKTECEFFEENGRAVSVSEFTYEFVNQNMYQINGSTNSNEKNTNLPKIISDVIRNAKSISRPCIQCKYSNSQSKLKEYKVAAFGSWALLKDNNDILSFHSTFIDAKQIDGPHKIVSLFSVVEYIKGKGSKQIGVVASLKFEGRRYSALVICTDSKDAKQPSLKIDDVKFTAITKIYGAVDDLAKEKISSFVSTTKDDRFDTVKEFYKRKANGELNDGFKRKNGLSPTTILKADSTDLKSCLGSNLQQEQMSHSSEKSVKLTKKTDEKARPRTRSSSSSSASTSSSSTTSSKKRKAFEADSKDSDASSSEEDSDYVHRKSAKKHKKN